MMGGVWMTHPHPPKLSECKPFRCIAVAVLTASPFGQSVSRRLSDFVKTRRRLLQSRADGCLTRQAAQRC